MMPRRRLSFFADLPLYYTVIGYAAEGVAGD
jgi:hypothetical protein